MTTTKRWIAVHERIDAPGAAGLAAITRDPTDSTWPKPAGGFDPRTGVRWDLDSNGKGAIHVWRLDDGRWALGHGVGLLCWIDAAEAAAILARHDLAPGDTHWATRPD